MTDKTKIDISNAVYEVYKNTSGPYSTFRAEKLVYFNTPGICGDRRVYVRIVRTRDENGVLYRLFMEDDSVAFLSIFGCWPIGFVTDTFVKVIEHYYNLY